MRAIFVLTDTDDGAIAGNYIYEGSFNIGSHAHQHMLLVQKVMDKVGAKLSEISAPANITLDELDPYIVEAMDNLDKEQFSEHDPIPEPGIAVPGLIVVKN